MKIGIFTQPLCTNYGAILQNYALQQVLKSLGHDPVTLEKTLRVAPLPLWRQPLATLKRFCLNTVMHDKSVLAPFFEWRYNRSLPVVTQHTRGFMSKYVTTREYTTVADIAPEDYDAFIVGSDQVWRPSYNFQSMQEMYLTFTQGWQVKRIAYAASLGTDRWELSPSDTAYYAPFVRQFDAVSVREQSATGLVERYFGARAVHVLDPTMLLSRDVYAALAQSQPKSPGSLMVHILDATEEKQQVAAAISKDFHLQPFSVSQQYPETDLSVSVKKRIQPPVEQWLRGIMDAEVVFTDSFHASVFAILFNKPLIAFCNLERGASRFQSLLNMFGLEHSLIFSKSEYAADIIRNTDFSEVNQRLESWRQRSMDFLTKALDTNPQICDGIKQAIALLS